MIERLLYSVDLFGLGASMNISGRDKSKSLFGGLCSLLFYAFLIWAFVTASYDMFTRSNPTSITSQSVNPNPPPITISPEIFPIAFQIQASRALDFETYINESIYTLNVYLEVTENKVLDDGTFDQVVTRTKIVTERCTTEHFGDYMGPNYALLFSQPVICMAREQPELDKIELVGGFDTPMSKVIMADMYMCDSSSSTCAPDDVLQDHLSGGYINILYNGVVIDPNNYNHPNSGFQDYYYTMLSPENYHEILVEVGHVDVITDSGWLVDNINTLNFSSTHRVVDTSMSTPNPDKILANIAIQLSQSENYHYRTYKKIQDVLAEMGGLTDAVLMILLFVISPYLKLKFSESIMNELFSIRIVSKNNPSKERVNTKNDQKNSEKAREISKNDTFIQQNLDVTNLAILQNDQTLESPPTPKWKGFWDGLLDNGNVKLEDMNYKIIVRDNGSTIKENIEELPAKTNIDQDISNTSLIVSNPNSPGILPLTRNKDVDIPEKNNKNEEPLDPCELKEYKDLEKDGKGHDIEGLEADKSEVLQGKISRLQLSFQKARSRRLEKKHTKQKSSKEKPKNDHHSNKMSLGFFEYLYSFISRSKPLKQKVAILNQGTKEIDMRLDINYMLKRIMDIDKLLSLLFDKNQLVLFDNLPKPELNIKELDDKSVKKSFSQTLLRSTTMKAKEVTQEEKILEAYMAIKDKEEKSGIDEKLLGIFEEKNCLKS